MKQINGNDLLEIGYPANEILGIALKINKKRNGYNREEMMAHYKSVLADPELYIHDRLFGRLAKAIIEGAQARKRAEVIPLREAPLDFTIYGREQIEAGALSQMTTAMMLPVTKAGALMPDAHQGYGLPIGGVLATHNAVIPYGVGVDIGCRMSLSVFDIPVQHFEENKTYYKDVLVKNTLFGAGAGFQNKFRTDHEVLDNPLFSSLDFVRNLKDKAWTQLGSSGGGNHFVEFGIIDFQQRDETLDMDGGRYVALLTHSGSRGFGATIAGHYTRLARSVCKLPHEAQNLAWLDLDSEAGQEYWLAMNLAGDYASACHETIHMKIGKALGAQCIAGVENHHNFAWKETWNGEEVIVHRKGATPASKDVMGVIPGSMTAPGFLVRGKGHEEAINSASHGAGRQMSRTQAEKTITSKQMKLVLADHGVDLIGGGKDEAPMAYKDIHAVMAAQRDLVDIIAAFYPKIVRMADDGSKED